MDECLYVVKWVILETGYTGEGSPISKDAAEASAAIANRRYSGVIKHWIEPVYTPRADD